MNAIIVISGKIGSGKTEFADTLAKNLVVSRTGFGDEVRAIAAAQGRPATRETWQEIGAELVARQPEQFCRAVLARGNFTVGEGLVIDGVRHVEILELLRTLLAPQKVIHIHVDSPDDVRQSRVEIRNRPGEAGLAKADQHSTERQVARQLPAIADVVVNGSEELDAMVAFSLHAIHEAG